MKVLFWSGGTAPPILTWLLDLGESSASRPCRFTLGKDPHYPSDGRLGGRWSWSERRGGEKILLLPGMESRPPCPCPVAIRTAHYKYI
jgi:hypothetical protein